MNAYSELQMHIKDSTSSVPFTGLINLTIDIIFKIWGYSFRQHGFTSNAIDEQFHKEIKYIKSLKGELNSTKNAQGSDIILVSLQTWTSLTRSLTHLATPSNTSDISYM